MKLTDSIARSPLPEVQTLRRTLMRWRREILAYFVCRLTNARTEGFNGKAKLVIRRAYGYKSFQKLSAAAPKLLCLNTNLFAPTAK